MRIMVKWIKLMTNIFDNRKIKQIEKLPEGNALIVMWIKLLCLAGNINDNGYIYFTSEIPYTDQMLANQFNMELTTIQLGLKTFEWFGMIKIIDNILLISNWERYQSVDKLKEIRDYNKIKQRESRARKKLLENKDVNDKSMTSQPCQDIDIDIDIDKDIEIDKNKNNIYIPPKSTKSIYGEYKNVKLTQKEYDTLQKDFGNVEELIKYLDEAKEMKNYKYKSDYLAIRKWVVEAVKKESNKKAFTKEALEYEDQDLEKLREKIFERKENRL